MDGAIDALLEFLSKHCDMKDGAKVTLSQNKAEWRIVAQGCACDVDAGDVDHFFDPYVRVRDHDRSPARL